ncbi:hypothetical protein QBC42DRAFT_265868 [Cladorrhinum samala]|uniref:Exonuclease domain-containing protein n=1 Tax=Cladorrhinum samala TaxID=585594 RepID=A0AAV9HTF9_9PEZI|nr:hypothetical protein QBC42DRAFT_265868 [Cladorrhinum samala]
MSSRAPATARTVHTAATAQSPREVATSSSKKIDTPQAPAPTKQRRPETLNPRHLTSAVPATHEFRLQVLKKLHEQFKRLNDELRKDAKDDEQKLVMSDQELIWFALDTEHRMALDKPMIYQNLIKNLLMSYRKKTVAQWRDERLAELEKEKSKGTARNPKPTLGLPTVIRTELTTQQEVDFLTFLQTPIEELARYGYVPFPPPEEDVKKAREGQEASLGWEICDRCTTRFQVFPGRREEDGALASGGKCVHHPGRTFYPSREQGVPKRYSCCQESVGDSTGCSTAENHVFKTSSPARLAALIPFMSTPPNPDAPRNRAVCFDCEMGYTVYGMELIRLTATSWPDGAILLDVLVKPVGEIIDLNSRYSGVWPEDIADAEPWDEARPFLGDPFDTAADIAAEDEKKPRRKMQMVESPMAARNALFKLISPETPLIGHGLENDLNAVRIIHPTLIDTILLYPTKDGLPMRFGLKKLTEVKLNKLIQVEKKGEGVKGGHDSAEDARAAGELVRFKVMEKWKQMKREGWGIGADGGFVEPEGMKKLNQEDKKPSTDEFLEQLGVGVQE